MNDTSKNILLSDVQGQGFLSIFNDLSSELMPHERSLLELMEGLDYKGFDSSLRRNANVDPKDMAIIIVYSLLLGKWNGIFFWLPIEELIRSLQQEYYDDLGKSDRESDSGASLKKTSVHQYCYLREHENR